MLYCPLKITNFKLQLIYKVHHFDMYHLRFKEIYHLDEAINIVILRVNHSRCKIPEFFVRKNYDLVAIYH